jgi:hypothetical protein
MIIVAKDKHDLTSKIQREDFEGSCMADIQMGEIRTLKQNARYWSGLIPATQNHLQRQDDILRDKEAIHEWLKIQRFGKKVDVINGVVIERCAKSRKMTTKQFAKYAEWAEIFAINELGVDPSEIDGLAREEG